MDAVHVRFWNDELNEKMTITFHLLETRGTSVEIWAIKAFLSQLLAESTVIDD